MTLKPTELQPRAHDLSVEPLPANRGFDRELRCSPQPVSGGTAPSGLPCPLNEAGGPPLSDGEHHATALREAALSLAHAEDPVPLLVLALRCAYEEICGLHDALDAQAEQLAELDAAVRGVEWDLVH